MLDASRDPVNVLRNAVAAAVMAPSSHNTQPWRFRISGSVLDVFSDPARWLTVIDSERRQQVQSCGCALYNARVALRAMGWEDEVTTMLVDSDEPHHLASLHVGAPHVTTDDDHALMQALALRHTNRRAFLNRPVSQADSDTLAAAAAGEGATMIRLDPSQKRGLAALVEHADQLQLANPAFRAELAAWLTPAGSGRRDGIPFVEKEYGSRLPFTLMRTLRSPTLGANFGRMEMSLVESAPLVAVIGTTSDDVSSWLACGQAVEAVLLRATTLGLSAAFLNQVLELPELRGRVAELVPGITYPHMVLRLGVPAEPIAHAAPRRELDDVLEIAA